MRFLVVFQAVHKHFRIIELRSMLRSIRKLSDLGLVAAFDQVEHRRSPPGDVLLVRNVKRGAAGVVLYGEIYAYIELTDEREAALVASKCVLIRAIVRPLGHGRDIAECAQSISQAQIVQLCEPLFAPSPPSYRVVVESFGRSLQPCEQLDRVHAFSFVHSQFPGRVSLREPQEEMWVLEDAFPPAGHCVTAEFPPARQVLFGRLIARGNSGVGAAYSLKKRVYIGPTSMDAELAFVMTNIGRVVRNSLVLDPFAGTGGVLVAAAALGAHTVAADINIIALRGKEECGLLENFSQYSLNAPLGVLRSDALHSVFRRMRTFDAIITDPPYGLKEGAKMFREESFDERADEPHYQSTQRIRIDDLLWGLLDLAADTLVDGGRLVYWLPTTPEYRDSDLPTHPLLELVHNCEQPLTRRMSRRLIVMVRKLGNYGANGKRKQRAEHERPAHFDLAAKLLFQPQRDESRLKCVER